MPERIARDEELRGGVGLDVSFAVPKGILGYSYMKHRATGQAVGPLTPVYKEDWPLKVPPPHQTLWRYMDLWKFEAMLLSSSLYFRRSDKLADQGEGRLSKEGVHGTSESELAFQAAYNINASNYEDHVAAHETTRSCMFVNCWNIATGESARMWREYTTSAESVVITTSMKALARAVEQARLVFSRVKYVNDSTPRVEFSHTMPFFYKAPEYSFENELRLLRPLGEGEQVLVNDQNDFGKMVPVNLKLLVHRIITHKAMPSGSIERTRALARQFCRRAVIESSHVL